MKSSLILVFFYWLIILPVMAEEPALPAGLGKDNSNEPDLPAGLTTKKPALPKVHDDEPALPSGLNNASAPALLGMPSAKNDVKSLLDSSTDVKLPFALSGFWEARGGTRVVNDAHERGTSIAESRLQLELDKNFRAVSFNLTTDLIYDNVANDHRIDLNTGRGWIDLRSANLTISPTGFMDIKAGRQILTWGTGDLLFINDLFPKDWNAFFIGRDVEYLKAPSDTFKTSLFSDLANLDIAYTPEFDADRFIDGRRISFFVPQLGAIAGRNAITNSNRPNDGELALRLYRNIGAYEAAVYFYDGHWKSPGGFDSVNSLALFPKLRVTGSSIRGPLANGIGNIEVGYYDSRDDNNGNNPFVNNSEFRVLAGYEQEIVKNLTLGVQYYLEHLVDHNNYLRTLPVGSPARDENRHLLTTRLTLLTHSQNVTWSVFSYYSPSDADFYIRPKVNYRINDHWISELGGNLFGGKNVHTFFGQFRDNSNIYLALRYGF
ncbi:conserved hypothetical protein [Candidatus Nitrotoga sp. BS]|uniref:hypothetical protein n=1 Tax=Candidatus Nitrotoga sp. BS TaxID=2890408 RepID=UPI001EF19EF1|nr:hypothetical protein [Candidatus Nitrotoga sp. BS]CAH1188975.1 conserved hypothetical protein [Candidatus Nitrotoga sp. BS]